MRTLPVISTTLITWSVMLITCPASRSRDRSMPLCPAYCKCKARVVFCDGVKMEAVPRRLPRNLEMLRFKDNRINVLHYDHFRGMFDLRHFAVTGNQLTYIEPTAFKDMYSLISLSLSGNDIEWLSEDAFKHLLLLKDLSLSRNRLKSVELMLSYLENVQVMNLAENHLERITERTFQGTIALRILDLHMNQIRSIHRRAFRRLTSLTFLILRDNPLVQLHVHFRVNHQLEHLDVTRCQLNSVMKDTPPGLRDLRLSENSINQVDSDDFQNPSSIQLLVLSYNSIDILSDAALEQMVSLYDLHLTKNRIAQLPNSLPGGLHGLYASYNRISSIGEKDLSTQQKLNNLILSHNQIRDIDSKAMRGLRDLVILDLSYNNITILRNSMFRKLNNLQRLDLSNNPIYQMEPGSFVGLHQLHILKMSSVEGSPNIRPAAFTDLHGLLYLDLSNSSWIVKNLMEKNSYAMQSIDTVEDLNIMDAGLRSLSSVVRINLPYLRMVKMSSNPWHCDTDIGWMSQWLRSGDVEIHEPENMVCVTPERLKGRRLADLTWTDLARVTVTPRSASRMSNRRTTTTQKTTMTTTTTKRRTTSIWKTTTTTTAMRTTKPTTTKKITELLTTEQRPSQKRLIPEAFVQSTTPMVTTTYESNNNNAIHYPVFLEIKRVRSDVDENRLVTSFALVPKGFDSNGDRRGMRATADDNRGQSTIVSRNDDKSMPAAQQRRRSFKRNQQDYVNDDYRNDNEGLTFDNYDDMLKYHHRARGH